MCIRDRRSPVDDRLARAGWHNLSLRTTRADLVRAVLEGVALHLPLAQVSHLGEVNALLTDVVASGLKTTTIYVSHLSATELKQLRASWPDFTFRPRVGTDLWLGARDALTVSATVLDVHPVQRGEKVGYWQRRVLADGWVVVLAGGTAHGIALEAPTTAASLRQRAVSVATGSMEALGLALSPFELAGKKRFFIEPPHMQHSMVFLPGAASVAIGDEVPVEVRLTAATVDRIVDET